MAHPPLPTGSPLQESSGGPPILPAPLRGWDFSLSFAGTPQTLICPYGNLEVLFSLQRASRQVPSLERLATSTLAFPASPWRCLMLTFLPMSKGHSTTETPLCTVHSVQPPRPPGRPCHVPVSGPALRLSLPGVLAEWPPRACCSFSLPRVAVPPVWPSPACGPPHRVALAVGFGSRLRPFQPCGYGKLRILSASVSPLVRWGASSTLLALSSDRKGPSPSAHWPSPLVCLLQAQPPLALSLPSLVMVIPPDS